MEEEYIEIYLSRTEELNLMAFGISLILTRHLWGIEETTLDEAVPCWAFAFVCLYVHIVGVPETTQPSC